MIDMRQALINDFIEVDISDTKALDKFINKLDDYVSANVDSKISAMLHSLLASQANYDGQPFEKCCEIASPFFDYLEDITEWEYEEFYMLSWMINYHIDYNRTYEFFQEAMDVLTDSEYVNDTSYDDVRTGSMYNLTHRIVHAVLYGKNLDIKTLKANFMSCYTPVMKICKEKDLPRQYILEIRRGFIEGRAKVIREAFNSIDKDKYKELHELARDEILEYLPYLEDSLSKDLSKLLTGSRIREARNKKGWTQDELAFRIKGTKMAGTEISQIELGNNGVPLDNLRRYAKVLEVSLCYLIGTLCPKERGKS